MRRRSPDRWRRLRQDLGLPARLWTAGHLGHLLVAAVRDHDRPAEVAVPALLAIAADPATRRPAAVVLPWPLVGFPDRPAQPGGWFYGRR